MISLRIILTLSLLTTLSIIDIRERRIPLLGQLSFLLLAVTDAVFFPGGPSVEEGLLGAVLAGILGCMLYYVGKIYGKWRGVGVVVFGMGDVRVLAISGASLGIAAVPTMFWRSALFGSVLAIGCLFRRMLLGRPIHRNLTIPYIPPIALAVGSLLFEMG